MVITIGLDDTCKAFKNINDLEEDSPFMAYVNISTVTVFDGALYTAVRITDMLGTALSLSIVNSTPSGYDVCVSVLYEVTYTLHVCMCVLVYAQIVTWIEAMVLFLLLLWFALVALLKCATCCARLGRGGKPKPTKLESNGND